MPALDPGRLRARLAPEDLTVLHALLTGRPVPAALAHRVEPLRAAGALSGGGVHPLAEAVVRTVVDHVVLVDVEVSGPAGASGQGVAVSGDAACLLQGWPGEPEGEYAMTSPGLVVPALALAAALVPAPADPERLPVQARLVLVDGALDALARAGSWDAAREAAVDVARRELGADADRLGELLADLRRAVRFTASGPGREPSGFVVLDAGASGCWLREVPAEPLTSAQLSDPELRVRLVPTTPAQLWAALVDLL